MSSSPPKPAAKKVLRPLTPKLAPSPLAFKSVTASVAPGQSRALPKPTSKQDVVRHTTGSTEHTAHKVPIHQVLPPILWPGDTQTLKLPWGGDICYARGGRRKEEGPVWIYFHGTPGCRLEINSVFNRYAESHAIRTIGIDRPGYGRSTLRKGTSILSHIEDIEYLLDYLGIQRFNVLSVSGGGRYALAAAYHFPSSRLRKTAIMCGVPHPAFENNMVHASWKRQNLYAQYLPSLWRWYVHRKGFNDFRWNKEDTNEQNDDNLAVATERNMQDQKGYVLDVKLSAQPWGFKLEDIRANRIMWFHGGLDKNTTCDAARATAEMVGGEGVDFRAFPALNHFNLPTMTRGMMLEWLRK